MWRCTATEAVTGTASAGRVPGSAGREIGAPPVITVADVVGPLPAMPPPIIPPMSSRSTVSARSS